MGHHYGGRGGITVGYEQDLIITQLTSMYFTQLRNKVHLWDYPTDVVFRVLANTRQRTIPNAGIAQRLPRVMSRR